MFDWIKKDDFEDVIPDQSRVTEGLLITGQSGFIRGTHVASNLGWRAVETLSVGDKVLTFDHGMQTITDIQRQSQDWQGRKISKTQLPLLVPCGALYNRRDMWLMPDQGLLIESESTQDSLGDPFAVIPASALNGFRGIERAEPNERPDVSILAFAQDEAVYVEGGMLAHCPKPHSILSDDIDWAQPLYEVMNIAAAKYLVECLAAEDGSADAFTCNPEEIAAVTERRERPIAKVSVGLATHEHFL
jgi:Hint domain